LLTHPTLDLLHQLGLNGMAKAFGEIEASGEATTLTHPEWLGLLLDQEVSYRRDRRLLARLRYARLRHQASVEDIDYRPRAVSIARCSKNSPHAAGSTLMRT
jgi:DNA replication protein DnaC